MVHAPLLAAQKSPATTTKARPTKSAATLAWEASGDDNSEWHGIPKGEAPEEADRRSTYVVGDKARLTAGELIGPAFRKPGKAAQKFSEDFNQASIDNNREYFSYIVLRQNQKGKDEYGTSSVIRGPTIYRTEIHEDNKPTGRYRVHSFLDDLPAPPMNAVATVHTHGKPVRGTNVSGPSLYDRTAFVELFRSAVNIREHFIATGGQASVLGRPRYALYQARVHEQPKAVQGFWSVAPRNDKLAPLAEGAGDEEVYYREAPRRFLPRPGRTRATAPGKP